ncbi:MAG TPA: CotH kinase family protein [Solirubrobacterales bacterium]|nr:CotH kinase family protein [Solirubrobacterales bacterium]
MVLRVATFAACCLGLLALPGLAAADEAEWLYDPDQVVEIRLGGLSAEELDALEAEPDEYVHGSFELLVGGVAKGTLLEDVGIRLKGGVGSSRPVKTGKSGFKVRFDEFVKGQLFFGLKRLTLNNMIQDPSMVHETLTYELFRDLGLPASRTGYAYVKLNGSDYGLFLNLETLDKISLPHWFATTQHLYEADAAGTDVRTGEAGTFEVDEGSEENISDLKTLIEAVNEKAGDWSDNVSPFANLEEMTRAWAVERYVSHWDGYAGIQAPFRPNNYYLHSDAGGVFETMPWGTDQTWEREDLEFDEPAGGIMWNECMADTSCWQMVLEGLSEVRCAALASEVATRAAKLAAMLAPFQDDEDEDRRETSPEEIAEELEEVEAFATVRPEQLEDFLLAEGILGDGPDPCAEPEEPEEPEKPAVTPQPVPPTIAPTPLLRFGSSKLKGRIVQTRVETPATGTVSQKVTAKLDGRRVKACSDTETRAGAAVVKIRCQISKAIQEARADGPLKLRIRVGFTPEQDGNPSFVSRILKAPKRG